MYNLTAPEVVFEGMGEINYDDPYAKRLEETGIDPEHMSLDPRLIAITPENYPIKGTGVKKVKYQLVAHRSPRVVYSDVLEDFANEGWSQPCPEHAYDFAKRWPDQNMEEPVLVLIGRWLLLTIGCGD